MHAINERIYDRDKLAAILRLQDGPVIADTDYNAGNFIRADEVLPNQFELIHCPGIEPRRGAGIAPPDPGMR